MIDCPSCFKPLKMMFLPCVGTKTLAMHLESAPTAAAPSPPAPGHHQRQHAAAPPSDFARYLASFSGPKADREDSSRDLATQHTRHASVNNSVVSVIDIRRPTPSIESFGSSRPQIQPTNHAVPFSDGEVPLSEPSLNTPGLSQTEVNADARHSPDSAPSSSNTENFDLPDGRSEDPETSQAGTTPTGCVSAFAEIAMPSPHSPKSRKIITDFLAFDKTAGSPLYMDEFAVLHPAPIEHRVNEE